MKANYKAVLAVLSLSFAAAAPMSQASNFDFNDSAYPILPAAEKQKTRAAVQQELSEARQNGALNFGDGDYPVSADNNTGTDKSRAQVKNELEQSKLSGEKRKFDKQYRG